jgi:hypothetical protein
MLADAAAGAASGACVIVVCGAAPAELAGGVLEADWPHDARVPEPMPRAAAPAHLSPAPQAAEARQDVVARAHAVSLVERLMELDQRVFWLAT